MLPLVSAFKGFAIGATDGRIGTVVDFLFGDASWKVRWLVVDCGNWLKRRKVLFHPSTVSYAGLEDEQFEVRLVLGFISVFGFLWRNLRDAVEADFIYRGSVEPSESAPESENGAIAEAIIKFIASDLTAP